jgi:hypothetical protein
MGLSELINQVAGQPQLTGTSISFLQKACGTTKNHYSIMAVHALEAHNCESQDNADYRGAQVNNKGEQ